MLETKFEDDPWQHYILTFVYAGKRRDHYLSLWMATSRGKLIFLREFYLLK